jgi:hypothetical protein
MSDSAIASQATNPKNRGRPVAESVSSGGIMNVIAMPATVTARYNGE